MTDRHPKDVIHASLAEVARALGHPHRLALLETIAQGARGVDELAAVSRITVANTSRHLQILRLARLVEAERQGKRVLYRLAGDVEVVGLLRALGAVGERNHAEIRRVLQDYFECRDTLEAVTRRELAARLHEGTVTVLDVRSADEFALGHVPGARNIPVAELLRRIAELPKRREIVAYCRGPYCVMAVEAVQVLRACGYRVRRLEDGFPEWKAAGFAVELPA